MQICQRETLSHQRAITHEVCCCTAEYFLKLRNIGEILDLSLFAYSNSKFQRKPLELSGVL